ncbi:hypothetical protein DAMA08_045720 [Martiniozyma asiatica (nom. inval.)]|nr:hypothetical protein DAMA08_045720 [Martiniozyma asiatica]
MANKQPLEQITDFFKAQDFSSYDFPKYDHSVYRTGVVSKRYQLKMPLSKMVQRVHMSVIDTGVIGILSHEYFHNLQGCISSDDIAVDDIAEMSRSPVDNLAPVITEGWESVRKVHLISSDLRLGVFVQNDTKNQARFLAKHIYKQLKATNIKKTV